MASIQGGLAADTTSDASYAAQAGIPLPAGYSPPPASSATPALNPNPCLGEDPGYSTGLTTAFYGDYIGKGQFDTTSPTFERCAICVPPDRLFNLLLWHYRRTLCPEEQESGIVRRCTEEQHGSLCKQGHALMERRAAMSVCELLLQQGHTSLASSS